MRGLDVGSGAGDVTLLLADQDDRCAICGLYTGESTLQVVDHDHDHARGPHAVHGLLCASCNVKLGRYESNRDAVDRWAGRPVPLVR
jgi:hypothetical protein